MKQFSFLISLLGIFVACQDYSNSSNQNVSEFYTLDSSMVVSLPYNASLLTSSDNSLAYEYDKKLYKVIREDITESWNLLGLVKDMAGDSKLKLSILENNDSIVVSKFTNGQFSFIGFVASQFERDGYKILLITYGIDKKQHQQIASSIKCLNNSSNNPKSSISSDNISGSNTTATKKYNGVYISCDYPSGWIVNESPGTMTADVYISNEKHSFGFWLFRFENDDPFKERMEDIADGWREYASVDVSYVKINGVEWCKQILEVDQEHKQISYYTQKGSFIYNIKFGNYTPDINQPIIDSIMASAKIN